MVQQDRLKISVFEDRFSAFCISTRHKSYLNLFDFLSVNIPQLKWLTYLFHCLLLYATQRNNNKNI